MLIVYFAHLLEKDSELLRKTLDWVNHQEMKFTDLKLALIFIWFICGTHHHFSMGDVID